MTRAAAPVVDVPLPHGVTISMPTDFVVLSGAERKALRDYVKERLAREGLEAETSTLSFAANRYDDSGAAAVILNVRFYPEQSLTQAEARDLTSADIQELDGLIQGEIRKSGSAAGFSLVRWLGTHPQSIGQLRVLASEYERSSLAGPGRFRVRLLRVWNGPESFTLTVSYRVSDGKALRPLCDQIIASIRVSPRRRLPRGP